MSIKVIFPGASTTVQDFGRYGYQRFGIPCAGVMDTNAYRIANMLTGNAPDAAVLEMTFLGGTYQFTEDTQIALTGADMQATLDNQPFQRYQKISVKAGQVLRLGAAINGMRAYLSVNGGIETPSVMGSRSTYAKCSIGGYEGRVLKSGDLLPTGPSSVICSTEYSNQGHIEIPHYEPSIRIRVIPGPQDDYFTAQGLHTFYHSIFEVGQESDRMGYRMIGPSIESINGTDIISDATVFGSIQITGSGQPIILMADHQTTGGYAKIATVHSEDLPLLAQAVPGTKVQFVKTIL